MRSSPTPPVSLVMDVAVIVPFAHASYRYISCTFTLFRILFECTRVLSEYCARVLFRAQFVCICACETCFKTPVNFCCSFGCGPTYDTCVHFFVSISREQTGEDDPTNSDARKAKAKQNRSERKEAMGKMLAKFSFYDRSNHPPSSPVVGHTRHSRCSPDVPNEDSVPAFPPPALPPASFVESPCEKGRQRSTCTVVSLE